MGDSGNGITIDVSMPMAMSGPDDNGKILGFTRYDLQKSSACVFELSESALA